MLIKVGCLECTPTATAKPLGKLQNCKALIVMPLQSLQYLQSIAAQGLQLLPALVSTRLNKPYKSDILMTEASSCIGKQLSKPMLGAGSATCCASCIESRMVSVWK